MKNNLSELNNYLFEELERLNDDETLKEEDELVREIKRSKAISDVAKTIIDNANVVLNAKKYADEMGTRKGDLPSLLIGKND